MAKSRKGAFVGLANSDYRPFPGTIGSRLCRMSYTNLSELRQGEVVRRIYFLGTSVSSSGEAIIPLLAASQPAW
jgi:hypothetical protein